MGKPKVFVKEGELTERISNLIDEYAGELSLVAVLGILEVIKANLLTDEDLSI